MLHRLDRLNYKIRNNKMLSKMLNIYTNVDILNHL